MLEYYGARGVGERAIGGARTSSWRLRSRVYQHRAPDIILKCDNTQVAYRRLKKVENFKPSGLKVDAYGRWSSTGGSNHTRPGTIVNWLGEFGYFGVITYGRWPHRELHVQLFTWAARRASRFNAAGDFALARLFVSLDNPRAERDTSRSLHHTVPDEKVFVGFSFIWPVQSRNYERRRECERETTKTSPQSHSSFVITGQLTRKPVKSCQVIHRYQTRERVFHQDILYIQTPRSGLKKRGTAEYFFNSTSRCLDTWWNNLSSFWHGFSNHS